MSEIAFTEAEKALMVSKLQAYFEDELGQKIGQFDAEFLLDFFSKGIGAHYYNRGLYDARAVFAAKVDLIDDEIYAIEKDIN